MTEETAHSVQLKNAENLSAIDDKSAALVVTSPPYPMIAMWDESFSSQNGDIGAALQEGQAERAFTLMHEILDDVWKECHRILCDGGVACINIGDATRTVDNRFQLFSNHARIITSFVDLGFSNLPNILWRKPTNAPNKFMGSGMYPACAYVTLEHEFILVFRKGNKREFSSDERQNRRESAYFWEERNNWFSDLWKLKGAAQLLSENGARGRSGAYPFELPYRLINMFSVKGDTVVDPFIGTGTTSLAAIAAGRNSIGYEIESALLPSIERTLLSEPHLELINDMIRKRILDHEQFVGRRSREKGEESIKYFNEWFGFPVMTRQERELALQFVESIQKVEEGVFQASYVQEALSDYQGAHSLFSHA